LTRTLGSVRGAPGNGRPYRDYIRDHVGPEYFPSFRGSARAARKLPVACEASGTIHPIGLESEVMSAPARGETQGASALDPGPLSFIEKMPSEARAPASLQGVAATGARTVVARNCA
jgi:hypothetical protein